MISKVKIFKNINNGKFRNIPFIENISYLNSFMKSKVNYFVEKSIIENKIKSKIKCDNLEIIDISGNCGTSFSIKLKSPDFKGKTIIMQHRMVNEALKEELKDIHALQIKSEASN